METELCIKDIINGLKSSRATDRKKNAEVLKDFLTRSETLPSLLTKNTLCKDGYTWNRLFGDVNDYILKETEKFETSKAYNNTRQLCTTLLHSCVSGSNRGKAYITCSEIIDRCLYILKDKRLIKAIGDEYLQLLFKHVLTQDHYLNSIAPSSWRELLEVCIAACLSDDFNLDNYTKLRLVYLVMKSARDNCQFVKPLICSLYMLEKCFTKVTSDKKAQDVILDIITLLLEMLSTEFRLTMCHFTESIFPVLIKYYDQNKEYKKKSLLFKLLNLIVGLHHPQGRLHNEEGSLANDWRLWNKYLNSITEIIFIEVGYLQRNRKQNDKNLYDCTHFYQLAAFIHYQMFMALVPNEDDTVNSSKRQKLSLNRNKTFSDVLNEMHQNHVPWLGVIHAYVQNYGASISATDYLTLLNHMQILLTNDSNLIWQTFEELACFVLTNLNSQNTRGEECDNLLISFWNTCVRNCTLTNAGHKSAHTIIQFLLNFDCLKYEHVQSLIKLYLEEDMPVKDYSVKTLNKVFNKFYNKCCHLEFRIACFNWLKQGDITCLHITHLSELVFRIISSENLTLAPINTAESENDNLRDILFNSIEKCILFSEFEENVKIISFVSKDTNEQSDIVTNVADNVEEYLKGMLKESFSKFRQNQLELQECIKLIHVVLSYYDIIVKHTTKTSEEMNTTEMFTLIKKSLKCMFSALIHVLESNAPASTKDTLIKLVQELLLTEFEPYLGNLLRSSIDGEFFYCINHILNTEAGRDDDFTEDDERELNMKSLKHNCIFLLAAYCRKHADYRDDILKLILNPDLYNFPSDILCVYRCIDMLKDVKVEDPPLDLIFTMMQFICKDWHRNSRVSLGILKILVDLIYPIFSQQGAKKENCVIMVKGYVKLCEDMHYSSQVASLIYECVAKIAVLNRKQNNCIENTFESILINKLKGDVHSIRLYCCYLLRNIMNNFSDDDIDALLTDLLDIFLIDVVEDQELVLKDESANRTLTVLHTFLALAQGKKSSVKHIILQVINIQKIKSLDRHAVKKVLNKIISTRGIQDLQTYLNGNILPVIYFWFNKNYTVEELPLYLFGFDDINRFIKRHMNWLVAADILWSKKGNVNESSILNHVRNTQGLSVENLLEECFSHFVVLCLPYIVSDKYKIDYYGSHTPETFYKTKKYAIKMFQSVSKILENKWNNLFGEKVGELLLLTATHLSDHGDAERIFKVRVPKRNGSYYYPKRIFTAILDYFQYFTDNNVVQYLCLNKPTSIFKILNELWKNVVKENIFKCKILALHAYVTFVKTVPLDCPTDAFLSNFSCKCFTHAIRECSDKEELRVYIEGLKICLEYLIPTNISVMRTSVLELLPVILIKKEEGYQDECDTFLEYLNEHLKDFLKDSDDLVDFLNSISQGAAENYNCHSMTIFLEKLKAFKLSLKCPSHETLNKICQFLKINNHFVRDLWRELSSKRFSEDCKTSVVHEFVHSLSCILKSSNDDKTIIEACNCLSEIGSYDLKTLVTVPTDPQELTSLNPKQYFIATVVKSLLEVLFDKDPVVTSKVSETLTRFLNSRQVDDILDLDNVQKQILKPFAPNKSRSVDTKVDSMKFEEHCAEFADGVFFNALVTHNKNSDGWLQQVTCTLLRFVHSPTKDIEMLRDVCNLKPQVCRKILPSLVGLMLDGLTQRQVKNISEKINNFFIHVWEETFDIRVQNSVQSSESFRPTNVFINDHRMIVQYMLDIVDFVRMQRNSQGRSGSALKHLNYLELEYDKIAWAAAIANQNWASIYYGELWAVYQNNGVPPSSPEAIINLNGGENLLQIFRKCYVSIGEVDAIDGCGTSHLTIEDEKRKHLINSGQYLDALLQYDIALSCGSQTDPDLHVGIVRSLHKSSMHSLALQYIKSQPDNEQLSDIKYECLSFLGDWSEFVDTRDLEERSKQTNCHHNSIIKAFRYACLKNCLNVQNKTEHEKKVLLPLNKAKLAVSRLCQNLNLENCQNIYKILAKIHLFNDIEDYFSVRTNKSDISRLIQQWDIENLPHFGDFKHLETLISQRVLILGHAAKHSDNLIDDITSLQIQYTKMALSNQRVEMAQRLLTIAKKSQASKDIILAESEILWAKGHKDIALSLLQNIVLNQSPDSKLLAVSLRQYALWVAELRRENPRDIINKYLLKSLRELKTEDVETRLKVYHDIAKFADAEYKQVVAYMNSSVYENRVKCVENMKGTASSLHQNKATLTNEEKRALASNREFKALDEAEIANTKMEKDNFLRLAMRYYLLSLKQYDGNNSLVFRVISLWLDNRDFDFRSNEGDNDTFEDLLHGIPSWKFISALPQLAPHLTNEDTSFITNLKRIIKRCAIDHPHHTMPILFGLKNSNKDRVILNASGNISGGATQTIAQDARTLAAHTVVEELADEDEKLSLIIKQMELLCDAIISFANYQVPSQPKKQKIPHAEMIHRLKNLHTIPVPTVTIPIRADCKYSSIQTLKSFDTYFELVGGINLPKKIKCTDSAGKSHVMLIKGRDDMRQDAVMQQVFNIVNALLEKDPVANRNKLLIRTYKVVPMSRQSGVLQWCEGTIPLSVYLTGDKNTGVIGAHKRYHPQDISCDVARKKMYDCREKSNDVKLSTFNSVLREFKPALHYFFTEHYLDPVTWYERRTAYTKSVATTSMLGYILGLGDRHVFNILIDQRTAEVIHIDLGISFDQGKTLPTPETVPFRLTQDIISGFGSSGVEGIFKRCCEKTMQLLRDNQETLLTILEVLLYDPLYLWSVKRAQQNAPSTSGQTKETRKHSTTDSNSGLAKRALLVVASKLSGTEDGAAGGVAVPGQVARLLHSAMDPFNLCRLFHGWQPYL